MLEKTYFETGGFKPAKSNSYGSSPAKWAAVSGATHPKPNAGSGIFGRKDESGNGKIPMCPNIANFEVAIAAVPLRCVPTSDVKRKPEKSVSSHIKDHDKGPKKSQTTDNTVHQKEDLWKNESDKLAAVIAEAKEFINLMDAKYSMPTTFPVVEDFLIDSGESKDQLPSLESDAFPLHTSIGKKQEKRERDKDFAESGKRLKDNSGISVVVQEEKDSGIDIMTEDKDEVALLSSEEWKVSQLCSNYKDECATPSIGKLEKNIERQSSLKIARECRNAIPSQGIDVDDYMDPISAGTKLDQPSERFSDCGSSDSDECFPTYEEDQDDALKMCSVDDEACATYSTNCNGEHEYSEKHKDLINLEIVQHDDPRGRKAMEALKLFKEEYCKVSQDHELDLREGKMSIGPHFVAAQHVKEKGMIVSTDKPFGHIPGVEIGDEFSFRAELVVVGLNGQYTKGIDYVHVNGKTYATSVVNSGRYENKAKEHGILIYTGEGGNPNCSSNCASADQQFRNGNRALSNSIKMGFPVRVIHKRKRLMESKTLGVNDKRDYVYVYDGLYKVHRYWQERDNQNGKMVYKFELRRLPGQPRVHGTNVEFRKQTQATDVGDSSHGKQNSEVVNGLPGQPRRHAADAELGKNIKAMEVYDALQEKERRQTNHGTNVKWGKPIQSKDVCMLDDVSKGKEKFKVRVVNGVDNEPLPPFTYITNIMFPRLYWVSEPIGCDCIDGCSDSVQCPCVRKNGCEIPYTEKGKLMRATKKVVHECGPSCKCPPSCMNRVSQHGPRFQLEIFKTKAMGWGVRSRDYITPGSFICEYIGELLDEKEADKRIDYDQYLFDICHGSRKEDDYALDAAKFGNIGRFINHSCDPNVFAQKVLYDHDDKKMPHIMFFASKRIPSGRELMYDYNYTKIRVRDANGNIRRKACHCGSRKCTGRLY